MLIQHLTEPHMYIWSSSQVEQYMRVLHQNGEHTRLLGDYGYPLRAWLVPPILNAASGSREELYTSRHIQVRNSIERCFGLLKPQWRCLLKHRTLHYHHHVASQIIHACCLLHNIALHHHSPTSDVTEQQQDDDDKFAQICQCISVSQDELIRGLVSKM